MVSSPILVIRWSSIFLPTITKRPRYPHVLATRCIITLGQRWRNIDSASDVRRQIKSQSISITHLLPSYRHITSQEFSDSEHIETTRDTSSSSFVQTEEEDEEGENDEILQTLSATSPTDDEHNTDGTTALQDMEDTITQPNELVDVRIPGRDSQVIMVSDSLVEMLQQNSAVVKARMPTLVEPDTTEPMIGAVPLIMYKGKETYFQFDYRNHPPITDNDTKNLVRKIERALRNTHLEPIGTINRGVETMTMNIENLKEGEDFRLSRRTYSKAGLFEPIHAIKPKTTRFTLLKSLTERHALYATGNNPRFGSLKRNKLGQSLFGEDSEIEVLSRDVARILRNLWCFGECTMFNGLQRRHFAMKRRKEGKRLKKILVAEMKILSYPEPLAKHMEKEGKVGLAHRNVDSETAIPEQTTSGRTSYLHYRTTRSR